MVPAASNLARQADVIFFGMLAVSVALLVGITVAMIYFVIRYRRGRNPVASDLRNNLPVEIIWTVVPTILVLGMFYYGVVGFQGMRNVPPDAMQVHVTARMWSWSFAYDNGAVADELRLPAGRPVRLNLHSDDVLHSFFVPAFRIKEDTVPGMETYIWFQPERVGTYDVFCAEYCGLGHSNMLSRVIVMEQGEFQDWYTGQGRNGGPTGAALVATKGCVGCHSLDGSRLVGPTFQGIFGRREIVVTGGAEREIIVDRPYLRRSILDPQADIVKGYPPVMPAQAGLLSDEELESILVYLESLQASNAK